MLQHDNRGGVEMGRTAELASLGNGKAVDTGTGEVLDLRERPGMFVYVPARPKWGEGWFMAIQEAFIALAKDKSLSGRPKDVLLYMMGRLDWDNYITLSQVEIAGELGIYRQQVHEAIKLLVERGIIQEGPKDGRSHSYRLNSTYGWKGKTINLRERRKVEALPEGTNTERSLDD